MPDLLSALRLRPLRRPPDYARRLREANAELATAPEGHLLLCGDSHAALLAPVAPPGPQVVNAAVGGLERRACEDFLRSLRFQTRSRRAVLSLGYNDLQGPRFARPAALEAYRRGARRILERLAPWTERTVFLALPPVDPSNAPPERPDAVVRWSAAIREICEASRGAAVYADPFVHLRTGHFGVATPGALYDRMHVADNAEVWRRLAPFL